MNYAKMDEDMIASLGRSAQDRGVGNQPLDPTLVLPDGTKQFNLTAKIADWEVEAGQGRQGLDVQRHGPRPPDPAERRRHRRVRHQERAPGQHRRPLARHHGPLRPGRRRPDHPGPDRRARPSPTASRSTSPRSACTTPTCTARLVCPTDVHGEIQVGDTPVVEQPTVSGVDPADVKPVQTSRWSSTTPASSASPERQVVPATEPIVVKEGEWVTMTYFNEGFPGSPDALHQFPAVDHRGRRHPGSTSPTTPTRCWSVPDSASPCSSRPPPRASGVPLPHPQPRRARGTGCSEW